MIISTVRPVNQDAPNFVITLVSMNLKWLTISNSILLVVGLGIIGFSAYRVVRGFEEVDKDLIGGEEIVVISENTPVVSTATSSDRSSGQDLVFDFPVASTPQEKMQVSPAITADMQSGTLKNPPENPIQDTFLTQIEKKQQPVKTEAVIPDRIVIPTIQLNAPVIIAGSRTVKVSDQMFDQWVAPNQFAAGWHGNSAYLGEKGNTVINGHHNEYGKVFGNLINLKPGETIYVYSGTNVFPYIISNKMILKEKNEDLQIRMNNSSWIQPSSDERLTLITCWPPETNTHRLVIVAVPFIISPERVIG